MTTSRSTTKPNRLHQDQIRQLEKKAGDKLELLLEHLGLFNDLRKAKRFYVGQCPVHGGSSDNSFNIFHTGYETVGNWRCFSHNCHKHFQPTVLGFVRGVLSHTKYGWQDKKDTDKECGFREAVSFLAQFCGEKDISNTHVDYEAFEKRKFCSQIERIYNHTEPDVKYKIPREVVRSSLNIPAIYYASRGYTDDILDKYDVGLCTKPNKEMTMRATVPIYDNDYKYVIGCTGRAIWDMCPLCSSYHNPKDKCPDERYKWQYAKWRHSYGFKGEFHLYNYWFAKKHISKTGVAILVEGPGDVWRLEEAGIHNSVALFGAHITEGQRAILDRSGALALVVLTDPDEAGRIAAEQITKECGNSYSLYFPRVNGGDMGDTEVDTIQNKLTPVLTKIQEGLGL